MRRDPKWLQALGRLIRLAERGDEEALAWCGFANLTALSILVVVAVLIAWVWI